MPKKIRLKVFIIARKNEKLEVVGKLFEAFISAPNTECMITMVDADTLRDSCLLRDLPVIQLHSKKGDIFYSGDFSNVEKLAKLIELAIQ